MSIQKSTLRGGDGASAWISGTGRSPAMTARMSSGSKPSPSVEARSRVGLFAPGARNEIEPPRPRFTVYPASSMSRRNAAKSAGFCSRAATMANLIRYSFCDLLILDEPLNNLDYSNVRAFSNVLTRIYRAKPELAIILVTHCRSIPIVNRIIEIDPDKKVFTENESYTCSSCFGSVDGDGFYR